MLYLSLKYEQKAREYFDDDYFTLFAVDHGTDKKCFEIIRSYPFRHAVMARPSRYKVCANIMEALKQVFVENIDYAINMEDDLILHETYFKFVHNAFNMVQDRKFSVITTWGYSPYGDPSILKCADYSCGPGTVISRHFFMNYMMQFANAGYYNNWIPTIKHVNEMNKDNPKAKYKIDNFSHLDWDGLMNRLVDYAAYKDNLRGFASVCFRLLHIGFYGFNRHGEFPPELKTFEARVEFLESNIFNPDVLAKLDRVYTDYHVFDPQLDKWDGSLRLEE